MKHLKLDLLKQIVGGIALDPHNRGRQAAIRGLGKIRPGIQEDVTGNDVLLGMTDGRKKDMAGEIGEIG